MPAKSLSFPNESSEYRTARNELLAAESDLRAAIEKVAAQRRALPLGGRVKEDYPFTRAGAGAAPEPVKLSELFGDKDTLFIYGFMFGPKMEKACPMCTSFLDGLNGNAHHLRDRIALAVSARSPIERIAAFGEGRGWSRLPLVSSAENDYQSDYFAEEDDGSQWPMANVFEKRDDGIFHTWGTELLWADTGQARHMDLMWPLWNVLDVTPGGRGESWYPSLSYGDA